jgi:hypothetical protein
MSDDIDLDRLAEIPDPFAGSAKPLAPRVSLAPTRRSPDRNRTRVIRLAAAAAALLCDAAWVAFVERRQDLASVPPSRLALGLAIPLAAAALALSAVTRRGRAGLGETKARVVTLAIASPALFAVATVLVAPAEAPDALFWRHAVGCIFVSALLAVGPLALGVLAFRHAFAMASVWRAAAVGVASGALAAATMTIVCSIGGAAHALVGHGAMMVIGGVVGAMFGARVCRA